MRCFRIGRRITVCLSPLLPYEQNFTQGRARKNAKHVVDNTNMAYSTLVSIPSSNISRNTSYPPKDKQPSQRSFKEKTSFDHQQNSKVSGMENLRERLSLSGVSETHSSLIANPRRSSSTGNYESAWCHRIQIDPVSCVITTILDFLGELFDAEYEYRTINSHRSPISAYHQSIDSKRVGSNDKVCKLFSGVFNLRPPQPKYTFTWDVQTALEYIKVNWPVNNVLSDKLLSLKLSKLLVLASASRAVQIQHLNISQMGRLPDQYKFVYTKLHKSWRKGKLPPSASFFVYAEDPHMCVEKCLDAYLDRTKV